jgi:biotin synthase-like enzyme
METDILGQAERIYLQNFDRTARFERAIFLSWYCSRGDCTFCYMSTQKERIKNPRLARRRLESVLAEALITKACGWNIEFLSGGYDSYTIDELVELTRLVASVYDRKVWLNMGALSRDEMKRFVPYVEGVCGAVETVNPRLHARVCPSKTLEEVEQMLETASELGLKRSVTIIIGLGESRKDIPLLFELVRKHRLDRITFYALNPHKGTGFTKGPDADYYIEWVARTRIQFPKLEIIAGSWVDRLEEVALLLRAGANSITKFPAIKLFSSVHAKKLEEQVRLADRELVGTMTKKPKVDLGRLSRCGLSDDLIKKVRLKINDYLR